MAHCLLSAIYVHSSSLMIKTLWRWLEYSKFQNVVWKWGGPLSHITTLLMIVDVQLNLVITDAELRLADWASLIIFDFRIMYKEIVCYHVTAVVEYEVRVNSTILCLFEWTQMFHHSSLFPRRLASNCAYPRLPGYIIIRTKYYQ